MLERSVDCSAMLNCDVASPTVSVLFASSKQSILLRVDGLYKDALVSSDFRSFMISSVQFINREMTFTPILTAVQRDDHDS